MSKKEKSPCFWTGDDFKKAIDTEDVKTLTTLLRKVKNSRQELISLAEDRIAKSNRTRAYYESLECDGEDYSDIIALCDENIEEAQDFIDFLTIDEGEFDWTNYMSKRIIEKIGDLI